MHLSRIVLSMLFFITLAAQAQDAATQSAAQATTPSTPAESFREGVIAFQKNDLKTARTKFNAALKSEPGNALSLYNLGLVEQKEGHLGYALGLWRKALALQPDFEPAQRAVNWGRLKLERAEIAHEVETWEQFRKLALVNISLSRYLLATAFLFFASGWLLLRYLGRRRRARMEEQPMPGLPIIGGVASILFFASASLALAKAYDQEFTRGTIVAKKVEARSSPDKAGTPLFDLYEGLEVYVRQTNEEWAQVTYPGASTGWIPKSAVFATDAVPTERQENP